GAPRVPGPTPGLPPTPRGAAKPPCGLSGRLPGTLPGGRRDPDPALRGRGLPGGRLRAQARHDLRIHALPQGRLVRRMTPPLPPGIPGTIAAALPPVTRDLDTLATPAVVIDLEVADAHLQRWPERCDKAGLVDRPPIQPRRSIAWAGRQIELGAEGVPVQTVGEAEVMMEAG